MNFNYAEPIIRIASALSAADVPYKVRECNEGWQIYFPWCNGDIAIHNGTYGHSMGKVESYCFPWDNDDVTVLSVDAAGALIISYYEFMNRITDIMDKDS